jgi:hypothetical protein
MRENCTYSSEGGVTFKPSSLPLSSFLSNLRPRQGKLFPGIAGRGVFPQIHAH